MSGSPDSLEFTRPARKRQRIPLACSACRDRKTRCDGDRPACSACVRRRLQETCSYEEGTTRSQKYISELEERVRELESGRVPTEHVTGQVTTRVSRSRPGTDEPYMAISHTRSRSGPSPKSLATSPPQHDDPTGVDALGTVSSLHRTDGFYGDSSTIAFVSKVKDAAIYNKDAGVDLNADGQRSIGDPQPTTQGSESFELALDRDPSAFVLPQRKTADEFLHCFWEFIHPLFPVIHKTTFLESYRRLWSPADPQDSDKNTELDDITFFAILNLIFALGCQFSTLVPPDKKLGRADEFYQRSRSLLVVDILDAMHLPLVQALLLTGVYLQSTKYANRCWNVVGFAIRIAQGLGMHIEQSVPGSKNQIEGEMRRRIWHNCVLLDRLLAMTFGRPTTIPPTWNVETPSMIDDEYLLRDGTGSQPPHLPSRMGMFVFSTRLFEILYEILATFYIHDDGKLLLKQDEKDKASTESLNNVLNLNSKLDDFLDSLPEYLKAGNELASDKHGINHITLQVNVLHGRFLYTRILLLRPVLLAMAQEKIGTTRIPGTQSTPRLQQELATRACVLCVTTAHKLIAGIHSNIGNTYRSSAWHSVYFTFAASTILIATRLCRLTEIDTNSEAFENSWSRSIAILEHYETQVPSASRAISVLESLRDRICTARVGSTSEAAPSTAADLAQQSIPSSALPPNNESFPNQTILTANEIPQFNIDELPPIDDAWFTQQFITCDWLNTPWEQNGFNF